MGVSVGHIKGNISLLPSFIQGTTIGYWMLSMGGGVPIHVRCDVINGALFFSGKNKSSPIGH
jgi:hypothetical protein